MEVDHKNLLMTKSYRVFLFLGVVNNHFSLETVRQDHKFASKPIIVRSSEFSSIHVNKNKQTKTQTKFWEPTLHFAIFRVSKKTMRQDEKVITVKDCKSNIPHGCGKNWKS